MTIGDTYVYIYMYIYYGKQRETFIIIYLYKTRWNICPRNDDLADNSFDNWCHFLALLYDSNNDSDKTVAKYISTMWTKLFVQCTKCFYFVCSFILK